MNAEDLIHIKISKIVPAQKWRVIRLVTKIWEFSDYVPTIEDATVIEKSRNIIKTRWRILMNGLPISWIEEDTLSLRENIISFRAIEGDLEEFKGEWKFQDHSEGTEVVVDIYLSVGIPGVKDFADSYIKMMVTKNFESIVESLEQRLISSRYSSFKSGNIDKVAGFGILGHFYNFNHLEHSLKMLNPTFKMPSREFIGNLFSLSPSFKIHEMDKYTSKTGDTTHGTFILCTFIPDMIDKDLNFVYDKVVRACKMAEKSGVGIVTLGGLTSMAGERLGRKINEDVDVAITTGNTFTAALAVEGVEKAAQLFEKSLGDLKVAVIGGTGDIGSACARVLTQKVKQITITGRSKINLSQLQRELRKYGKAKVIASRNNKKAVSDADIVIASATASSAILAMDWFKTGSIICDLGYPKNISYKETDRKDIFVFSGGLASVPSPIDTGVNMGIPSSNVCYGCFCEVIILALEHRYENYSFGRGKITPEKMDEIRKLGIKHGFHLAPFFWANREIDEEQVNEFRMAAK